MTKGLSWIAGLSVLAALLVAGAQAKEGHEGHHGPKALCPMHINGAQVQVTDTDGGVTISITAKDPAAVKEIQAAAAAHAALKKAGCPCCAGKAAQQTRPGKGTASEAVYACPMKGCYKGPNTKDGRCPHCGMNLQKL
ncbi:MAG: hypothetical protein HY926_00320 [Elusimicrobia bacterium]|nr:hypothetical protein [Elusimicrobiota bacterium]